MKKHLKYKYYTRESGSLSRFNKRIIKFKRPKFKHIKNPLKKRFIFNTTVVRKRLKFFSLLKHSKGAHEHRYKFLNKGKYKYVLKRKRQNKVIDPFAITLKSYEAIKGKEYHGVKVNLNLVYKLTYGKKLKRESVQKSGLNKVEFMQNAFLSKHYNLFYLMPRLHASRSILQTKEKVKFKKILLNGRKAKSTRAERLKKGDIISVRRKFRLRTLKAKFMTRPSYFSFLETDNYTQKSIICKGINELSRSDGILLNPGSRGLVEVNFLRR